MPDPNPGLYINVTASNPVLAVGAIAASVLIAGYGAMKLRNRKKSVLKSV
jgi:hypothetical protein